MIDDSLKIVVVWAFKTHEDLNWTHHNQGSSDISNLRNKMDDPLFRVHKLDTDWFWHITMIEMKLWLVVTY